MATREADLDLGGEAKKTAGGGKSLLMMGNALARLDECPSLGTALPVTCITDDLRPARTRDMASVATRRVHVRAEQATGVVPTLAITACRVAAHA